MSRVGSSRRDLFEAALDGAAVGIVVADAEGTVALVNEAARRLLGGESERVVGQRVDEAQAEVIKWRFKNPEEYERRVGPLLAERGSGHWEQETVEGVNLAIDLVSLRGPEGEPLGSVQSFGDISEPRRELAEALHEADARLTELEQHERAVAERVLLTHAAYQIAVALTPEEIIRRLAAESSHLVSAQGVAVIQGTGSAARVIGARGFEGAGGQRLADEATEALTRATRARRTLICNDSAHESSDIAAAARALGFGALMLVPIALAERVYGVLAICVTDPQAFTEREVRQLNELSGHAATALGNAQQFVRNRELAESFQHSVVPRDLPTLPGLSLGAFYRGAAGELTGGDFYDVIELAPRRAAIVLGDVSGKGPQAAATTAMVRHMIEGLVASSDDPGEITGELNRLLYQRIDDDALVTIFVAVCDLETDQLRWCNAGHTPPIVLGADGSVRTLGRPAPPCGCFEDAEFATAVTPFPVGETVVLYTDGLTEARRGEEEFGIDRVCAEGANLRSGSVQSIARGIYAAARVFAADRIDDDVAIVVARRVAT